MRHIDLFSGIGGFSLAANWAGYRTEVFCERDDFCRKVLAKHWPDVPIVGDIHDFDGRKHIGADLLTGGIPCQPYSCAGKQLGNDDDRALWPQMRRVITEARPHWVVIENVAGFINMALDGVLADLEAQGYDCGTVVLPACAVNAPHRRDRVCIVAHTDERGRNPQSLLSTIGTGMGNHFNFEQSGQNGKDVANCNRKGLERRDGTIMPECAGQRIIGESGTSGKSERCGGDNGYERELIAGLGRVADGLPGRMDGHFDCEPDIPRVAKGIPNRAARLKALGNAIVPQVAYQILKAIDSSM